MKPELQKFQLGLDLGTNSIGWACVATSTAGENGSFLGFENALENRSGLDQDARDALVDWGVYVFPESFEEDNTGVRVTLASERGRRRRQRRTLRRRRYRRNVLTRLLVERGLLPADPHERVAELTRHAIRRDGEIVEVHPYAIRARAVTDRVEPYEIGKALYHMCRHRGFLSTRELMQLTVQMSFGSEVRLEDEAEESEEMEPVTEEEKERSEMKRAIRTLARRLEETGQTLGQALYDELKSGRRVRCRTKGERIREGDKVLRQPTERWKSLGAGLRFGRQMLIDEFHALWDKQAEFHAVLRDTSFRQDVFRAIFFQHPLREQKHLRGFCTFHPSHRRTRRATLMAQRSMVLQYLNTLSVLHAGTAEKERGSRRKRMAHEGPLTLLPADGPVRRKLFPSEIRSLFEALQVRERLSWEEAAQIIDLPEGWVFSDQPIGTKRNAKTADGQRPRPYLLGNVTSAHIASVVPEFPTWPFERQERLVHDVLELEPAKAFRRLTEAWGLSEKQARELIYHEYPDGQASVCRKVLARIEPFLLEGQVYSRAMESAGYAHSEPKVAETVARLTPELIPAMTNPVVRKSVGQAFKVINAVIDRYGLPERIRLEIPREVSLTNKQRQEIWQSQNERFDKRKAAAKLLTDNGFEVFPANVDKVLLWEEFGRRSPYDPTKDVSLQQLIEDYDIEHIWPRSRSADDSWTNKTIASRSDNMFKGDMTPYECWGKTERWQQIKQFCQTVRDRRLAGKVARILEENFDEAAAEEGFVGRQLSDTRYISKVVMDAVKRLGVPVEVGRGQMTATLRRLWRIENALPKSARELEEAEKRRKLEGRPTMKKDRDDHRHHAIDALVVACIDRSLFQKLTKYYKSRSFAPKEAHIELETPWPGFRESVMRAIPRVNIVYAPNRRLTGALHEETAYPPPSREEVEAALRALPAERRARIRDFVPVGNRLVRIDAEGNPLCAYKLGNNHHAVIWRSVGPNFKGSERFECEVVTVLEARARLREGRPLFERERPGWRAHLHLCKGDIVEYAGDEKFPGAWYVVSAFTATESGFEVRLFPLNLATREQGHALRVRGQDRLRALNCRLILSPIGEVLGYEPSS